MMNNDIRTAEVEVSEAPGGRGGYHIVRSHGIAGTWWACSRSGDEAISMAVYASLFGECPRSPWEPPMAPSEVDGMGSPIAVSWRSESDAREAFERMERAWSAALRGTLVELQSYAEEDDSVVLTDEDFEVLNRGGHISLPDGRVVIDGLDCCAHVLTPGTYWGADGNCYEVPTKVTN
jgi:hypothetical protein